MARADEATGNALLLSQYQATTDADEVDLNLIEALLAFVCGEGHHARPDAAEPILGAVLVFLPGAQTLLVPAFPRLLPCVLKGSESQPRSIAEWQLWPAVLLPVPLALVFINSARVCLMGDHCQKSVHRYSSGITAVGRLENILPTKPN